jgi:threonine dehydratase
MDHDTPPPPLDPAAKVVDLARRFGPLLREALPVTPLERATYGGRTFLVKREDRQETGSFKVRGALCRLAEIDAWRARCGVVCASAGNHGKGVAWAAGRLGILATVVVPRETPAVKRKGIRDLGADLVVHEEAPGYDAAEAAAKELARARGAFFISPFDDPAVQAGNGGTVALEIMEQEPRVERVIAPVGGGGFAGGLAAVFAAAMPLVEVQGVQSEASPAMSRSLRDGRTYWTWDPAETLAEGLEGGVADSTVALCRGLAGMHEIPEREIARAMVGARRELGLTLEGSAAVALAAVALGVVPVDERTVVVLTGRNVDPERLAALEARFG